MNEHYKADSEASKERFKKKLAAESAAQRRAERKSETLQDTLAATQAAAAEQRLRFITLEEEMAELNASHSEVRGSVDGY